MAAANPDEPIEDFEAVEPLDFWWQLWTDALQHVLKKHGYSPKTTLNDITAQFNELGRGVYGVAFELPDGKVLKITSSEEEARLTKNVMALSKKTDALVTIHDIHTVQFPAPYDAIPDFYFIIMDKARGKTLSHLFLDAFTSVGLGPRASAYSLGISYQLIGISTDLLYPSEAERYVMKVFLPMIVGDWADKNLTGTRLTHVETQEVVKEFFSNKTLPQEMEPLRDVLETLNNLIECVMSTLVSLREDLGFIHSDAHVKNMFVEGDMVQLIDFSECEIRTPPHKTSSNKPQKTASMTVEEAAQLCAETFRQ